MKVTVCIGSSCHIKGSRQVIEQIQSLIAENKLEDKVDLGGTFCLGNCQKGVCVMVDDEFHSVSPETTQEFFDKELLTDKKQPLKSEKEVNTVDDGTNQKNSDN